MDTANVILQVAIILVAAGAMGELLNQDIYTTVVIVIAYTTLFTPFRLRLFYKHYGHLADH